MKWLIITYGYLLLMNQGFPVTNQNLIHDEIKSPLISVNGCFHSIKYFLSFRLLSKIVKIKIYKTIILLWFCMGVKHGF
jgi:hypothetical protein